VTATKGGLAMRTLASLLFLLISSSVFADELRVYKNHNRSHGDYYRHEDKAQEYEGYTKKPGSYLKQKGDKLQQYDNYMPVPGEYYKRKDDKYQKYENNVPKYGEYLR